MTASYPTAHRIVKPNQSNELDPFDVPTCSCCAGQWSQTGTTYDIYRICEDCLEQGKVSKFIAQRSGSRRRWPKSFKDMVVRLFAQYHEQR